MWALDPERFPKARRNTRVVTITTDVIGQDRRRTVFFFLQLALHAQWISPS